MTNFDLIKKKLERFVIKFHINELIKGSILFFAIGALYFLTTVLIESFFWLSSIGRTILFWLFIVVETTLFIRFIIIPITKIFKLTRGIDYKEASDIIGRHFPKVNDRLLNVLQLSESDSSSDLLIASIEQKSKELKPIPFKTAISFKKNSRYLKYAALPVVIFALLLVFNKKHWISDSYNRVIHYEKAYEPPAPFQFFIVNDSLETLEDKNFVLKVKTSGNVVPENATITYNNEVYFLKSIGIGEFEYTFLQPKKSIEFFISANNIHSRPYSLSVVSVPALLDFEMMLDYPAYTGKKDYSIKSSGNATIPEGTKVKWVVSTRNTDKVELQSRDSLYRLSQDETIFTFQKSIFNDFDYEIKTSNKNINHFENLAFTLDVVKDQHPELQLQSQKDTIHHKLWYFYGKASDDYGLSKLQLVYYDRNNPSITKTQKLEIKHTVFDDFIYIFPNDIILEEGIDYEFYFEVFDNDVIHNHKSTKSTVFSYRKLTRDEEKNNLLKQQNEAISGIDKSLKKFEEQQESLKDFSKIQKEKKRLDFNDKKKLNDFLKRQKLQNKMMKNFSEKLKENLDQFEDKNKEEPFKDALKEKLMRNEERLKRNKELLDEIEQMSDKIKKEELTEKLEELGKEKKNLKKSLEQLLELTKRYYVMQKHERLAEELDKLSKKQEELSNKSDKDNTKEEQDKMNKEFDELTKDIDKLKKDNKDLKKPIDLNLSKKSEENIKEQQQKASDNLQRGEKNNARKNQKSAAEKMKQMSNSMQMQMQMAGEQQQEEDINMLRQVLDNLVDFSMSQENLMKGFKNISIKNPIYSSKLKQQNVLKENFSHIDDSIYSLALRTPQITETISQTLTDIGYNIDKSLEHLSENEVVQGSANQHYTITGSNDLAYMLSSVLDNMQNSMASSSGKGKSGKNEFQLPDIIKKQEDLNKKMGEGTKKSEQKGNKEQGQNGEGKDGENSKKKDGKGKNKTKGMSQQQSEEMNGELYEIYKQQQQLRNALQDQIEKEGIGNSKGSSLLRKMKQVENELLEKGFNKSTLSKMLHLQHELLKLKEATFEQGKDEKRKSNTNTIDFENTSRESLEKVKQYFNTTEILNRQVLPLRHNYKQKVQEYFQENHD